MAIRFTSANAEHIAISSNALNYNADYTWMAWIYLTTDTNNFTHFFGLHDSGDGYADDLGTTSNGTTLSLYLNGGSGGTSITDGSNLSTQTWYHIALVRSGSSVTVYLNGVADIGPVTHNPSGRNAISRMRVGTWDGSSEFFNGRWGYSKAWTAALSAAEVLQEMYIVRPSRVTNLYGWWPTLLGATEQLADYSGNAHGWSQTNTPTDEDPPPVSWGGTSWALPGVATGAQTIADALYADADSFGADALKLSIVDAKLTDADSFGADALKLSIVDAKLTDADSFGADALKLSIVDAKLTDADSFGADALKLSIGDTAYSDPDTFGADTLTQSGGVQTITDAAYSDPDSFGADALKLSVADARLIDADSFGADRLGLTITDAAYADADSFGADWIFATLPTPAERIWPVAYEARTLAVVTGNRTWAIAGESRVTAVAYEDRALPIAHESRVVGVSD